MDGNVETSIAFIVRNASWTRGIPDLRDCKSLQVQHLCCKEDGKFKLFLTSYSGIGISPSPCTVFGLCRL